MDGAVVEGHLAADLQQQGDGKLGHGLGAVGGHIAHRYSLLPGVVHINNIVAGGQDAEAFHPGTAVDDSPANGGFIDHHDLRIPDALHHRGRVRGHLIVDPQLSQLLQGLPAQIPGILHIGV